MLQTVYYDPLRFFDSVRRQRDTEQKADGWSPKADIIESSGEYRLMLDLPGIEVKSIDITQEKNLLIVQAKRAAAALAEGETLIRSETRRGEFRRQFNLPEDADASRIEASSQDGVLTLVAPRKQPGDSRRRIEINNA